MDYKKLFITGAVVCAVFVSSYYSHAYAAGASITASPGGGSVTVGQTIDIAIILDSDIPFNAAQSTITLSPTLQAMKVTQGNCDFSLVETPSTVDPSFVGVILGGQQTHCTVYTLTLRALSQGAGYIRFSENQIKSYKDAKEIYASETDGNYTVNAQGGGGGSSNTTPITVITPAVNSIYNVAITTPLSKDTKTNALQVVLDQNTPQEKVISGSNLTLNGDSATGTFNNVSGGLHTVNVLQNGAPVSHQVLTIAGLDKNVAFSMSTPKRQLPKWILISIIIVIIITTGAGAFFLYRFLKARYFTK